jgi:hypothetical protein
MSSTVRISWTRDNENEKYWTEICARAIEVYGLPGNRFQTHANVNYMDFVFKSNKDALMFAIEHNGKIVPDDLLTVEHFGKLL